MAASLQCTGQSNISHHVFASTESFFMIYRISWTSEIFASDKSDIPKFLYIDSLPLRDDKSNILPTNFVCHLSPHDFPQFHRRQYPECFRKAIEEKYAKESSIYTFSPATIFDIESYNL